MQIVLNNLLEDEEDPPPPPPPSRSISDDDENDGIAKKKNKATNGMRVKNRKKPTEAAAAAVDPVPGPSGIQKALKRRSVHVVSDDEVDVDGDLESLGSEQQQPAAAKRKKREDNGGSSSSSSSSRPQPKKIELTEDQVRFAFLSGCLDGDLRAVPEQCLFCIYSCTLY